MIKDLLYIVVIPLLVGIAGGTIIVLLQNRISIWSKTKPFLTYSIPVIFLFGALCFGLIAYLVPRIDIFPQKFMVPVPVPSLIKKDLPVPTPRLPLLSAIFFSFSIMMVGGFNAVDKMRFAKASSDPGFTKTSFFKRASDRLRPLETSFFASLGVGSFKLISAQISQYDIQIITILLLLIFAQFSLWAFGRKIFIRFKDFSVFTSIAQIMTISFSYLCTTIIFWI